MGTTLVGDVSNQVQKYWSPLFVDELKEDTLLPALVNKDYQGDIKKGGDTVFVSQIQRPDAQIKTVGDPGSDTFSSQKLTEQRIAIVADRRLSASYEFEDLVDLQSQMGDKDSKIRQGLVEAMEIKLNEYLAGLAAPSDATPDHSVTGVADFNAAQLAAMRLLASQAKWPKNRQWYCLLDPVYYADFLNATTMTSSDYQDDRPLIGGQFATKRMGFNVLEDNSKSTDTALLFYPDYLHLVMQKMPQFKVSDLHGNKQFGYVISVDMLVGAKLGIDGDVKHITVTA